jgi:hypothetical protein
VADGQYLVTTRENQRKRCRVGVMYCDGRGMMHDQVTGLRQGACPRAPASASPALREARSSKSICWPADGRIEIFFTVGVRILRLRAARTEPMRRRWGLQPACTSTRRASRSRRGCTGEAKIRLAGTNAEADASHGVSRATRTRAPWYSTAATWPEQPAPFPACPTRRRSARFNRR